MHFNLRLFEYPNGEVQVRYYSTPLYKQDEKIPVEMKIEQRKKRREAFEETHSIEPFTHKWVKEVQSFDELDRDAESSFFRSANRSKQAVYTYARCEFWEWFVTFTVADFRKDRYDFSACSKAVRVWLNNQKERYAPNLKYLCVPEQHKDGAWHFHALLCNCGNIPFVFSGKVDKKGQRIFNLDSYRLGFTTATRVSDYHKVARYIGKYITKTLCSKTSGKQRYFVSKTINKPVTSIMLINRQEELYPILDMVADSFGLELVHAQNKGDNDCYTKCSYFEFQ